MNDEPSLWGTFCLAVAAALVLSALPSLLPSAE